MSIATETLAQFLNPIFVETGSYRGDGIRSALEAGFADITSVELDPKRVVSLSKSFADEPAVTMVCAPSSTYVKTAVCDIQEPVTFWLDAHPPGYDLCENNCPTWSELFYISRHCTVPHIVLVDDMRCFQPASRLDLIMTAKTRFPDHIVGFVDGSNGRTNDILMICPEDRLPEHYTVCDEKYMDNLAS